MTDPVTLPHWLAAAVFLLAGLALVDRRPDDAAVLAAVEKEAREAALAAELMTPIGRAVPVLPVALVAIGFGLRSLVLRRIVSAEGDLLSARADELPLLRYCAGSIERHFAGGAATAAAAAA